MVGREKTELVKKLTGVFHEVLNIHGETFNVLINVNSIDNNGIGGKLSSEKHKEVKECTGAVLVIHE